MTADAGAQTRFDCDECGACNYVGDLDVYVEGGRDLDEDDGADDEDDEDDEDVLAAFEHGEPVITTPPEVSTS